MCSPLLISQALYGSAISHLSQSCVLLASRDVVVGLLLLGSVVFAWRTARVHTTEFATFLFILCVMGSLFWSELLALAAVNYAIYLVVVFTAHVCAFFFDEKTAAGDLAKGPHALSPSDPANIRMWTLDMASLIVG
jgi:hypothetical protein